jgi:uncharacterized protein YgfB (UPF0149 family)
MLQVTFAEIARVLLSLGSVVPAAEAHGCLCGALCIDDEYTFERWRDELLAADQLPAEDEEPLRLLFSDTVAALGDQAADFEPLLPEDDVALEQRTSALAQWTSGFLYGFGTARPLHAAQPSPTVEEILGDFARMGVAAVEAGTDEEEQERAYAELLEYLRVGVWLAHAERKPAPAAEHFPDVT